MEDVNVLTSTQTKKAIWDAVMIKTNYIPYNAVSINKSRSPMIDYKLTTNGPLTNGIWFKENLDQKHNNQFVLTGVDDNLEDCNTSITHSNVSIDNKFYNNPLNITRLHVPSVDAILKSQEGNPMDVINMCEHIYLSSTDYNLNNEFITVTSKLYTTEYDNETLVTYQINTRNKNFKHDSKDYDIEKLIINGVEYNRCKS